MTSESPNHFLLEIHLARGLGKQSIILATANTDPGIVFASPLTDNNHPRFDGATAKNLHSQTLGLRIAT